MLPSIFTNTGNTPNAEDNRPPRDSDGWKGCIEADPILELAPRPQLERSTLFGKMSGVCSLGRPTRFIQYPVLVPVNVRVEEEQLPSLETMYMSTSGI